MGVLDRQHNQDRAAGPTATPHGRNVVRNASQPSTPIVDVPIPGGENAPFDAAALNQATQTAKEAYVPVPESAEVAFRLAEILKTKTDMPEESRRKAIEGLRIFEAENPEAMARYRKEREAAMWAEKYIDTTPHQSSRLISEQRKMAADVLAPGIGVLTGRRRPTQVPKTREDLAPVPADSAEAIIDRLESEGVDTTTGVGGFWDNVGFAIRLNNSNAQAAAILGLTMDNIEAAGIPLPEGVVPISVNQDLQKLEVLQPTADGKKLRRTLVDPEVLGLNTAGQLFDLEELFAGIYASTAAVRGLGWTSTPAGRHPFVRELVGDYAGRNVGIMLEAAISAGMGEFNHVDLADSLRWQGNFIDTGVATVTSRTLARTGRAMFGSAPEFARKYASGSETPDVVASNIEAAAQTLEDVNRLVEGADNVLPFTVEAGSLSQKSAQTINARMNTLNNNKADAIEVLRRERRKTLGEAFERATNRAAPADSPRADAHTITSEATGRVNSARQIAADRTRSKYTKTEGIKVTENPDTGLVRYSIRGEVDKPVDQLKPGETAGEHGVDVFFGDDTVHIVNMFEGEKFAGATRRLLFQVMDDAGERTITFGDTVSPSAQKAVAAAQRQGLDIVQHADAVTDAQGNLVTPNLEPVYTLRSRPGELAVPRLIADAEYDRATVEAGLERVEELIPWGQRRVDEANVILRDQIGWSNQKQSSNYYLNNAPNSGLRQQVRMLQNRVDNVLTGVEANEANKALYLTVRKDVDEETGETLLAGLADEQLDIGNLLHSRARLNQHALDTGDKDVARVVQTIDNLLANQSYISKVTGRAQPATTAGIRESITRARAVQADLDELVGLTMGNKLFKRNANGQFINTDLQAMGRLLGNGSATMNVLEPILERDTTLREGARDAIGQLYKNEVLREGVDGVGWSATAHSRFLKKYDTAINLLFPGEEQAIIRSMSPPRGLGTDRFTAAREVADTRWRRLVDKYAPKDAERTSFSNPKDIVASFGNMGGMKTAGFMRELDRLDPTLASHVRKEAIEQTRTQLHRQFFDMKGNTANLKTGRAMRAWYADNKDVLKALHGDQYVTDLNTIVRGLELDDARVVLRGQAPPSQHDWIRVTRSFIGPLSSPQRKITAGNYVNNKRLAAKAMDIYSDPAMLRAINDPKAKGVGVRTEAGIALGVRLGVFEAMGIPRPESEDPKTWSKEFLQQVMSFYDSVDAAEADRQQKDE